MRFGLNEITSHCFNKVSFPNIILNMVLSCKIFEHFALQTDPVTELIKLGFAPFKEGTNLAQKLAGLVSIWISSSTPSKNQIQ
jgi:hypothetical protein